MVALAQPIDCIGQHLVADNGSVSDTSRPLLLAEVARLTQHAGQSRLLLTLTHAAGDLVKSMVTNVRRGLDTILATAPQLTTRERWPSLASYIVEKIIDTKPKITFNLLLTQSNFSQQLIPATSQMKNLNLSTAVSG